MIQTNHIVLKIIHEKLETENQYLHHLQSAGLNLNPW